MRALVFFGDECKLEELAMPVPSEDDVVVRVQSVLLDRTEIIFPAQPDGDGAVRKSPRWTKRMIPGRFVLGTVVAVGADIGQSSPSKSSKKVVTHRSPLAVGMRVMGLMDDKGCAEFTVIHAAFVFPLEYLARPYPQYLSFTTTTLLLAIEDFLTANLAHYVTFFQAHIAETDTVAVFGADTPFGHALTTTLRRQRIEVIPFTEHPIHHQLLLTETTVNAATEGPEQPPAPQLRYERDPNVFCQADVVLDPFGTSHLPLALTFVKRLGGRILFYDTLHPAAALTPETLQMLYKRSVTLQFANIRQLDRPLKHALRRHFDQFLATAPATTDSVASTTTREMSTVVECAFALDDIARAFALLDAMPATPATPATPTAAASTTASSPPEVSAIVVHLNSASTAVMELSQELDVLLHQKLRFQKFPPPANPTDLDPDLDHRTG